MRPQANTQPRQPALGPLAGRESFWRRHRGLLAVALVAVLSFYVRSWEGDLHGDPVHYAAIARTMVSTGDWLHPQDAPGLYYARKPPLMFWLVALNFKFFGVSVYAAKFWSAAFAVGVCLLTYLVGRRPFGETAGILAGAMMATFPGVVPNAVDLRLDSGVSFFTILAAYGALRAAQDERPRWLLLPGLAAGLGLMLKPVAALHAGVLTALVLALWRPRLLRSPYLAGAVLLCAALAAPWHLAMLSRPTGHFGRIYFGGEIDSRLTPGLHIFRNMARYLAVMSVTTLPWWPLGAYALARRRRAGLYQRRGMMLAVLWLALVLVTMAVPVTGYDRYMVPAYPAVALLAGWGLSSLLSARARARVPAVVAGYALAVTCLLAIAPYDIHPDKLAGFTEARSLLHRLDPGATVAAYRPKEPAGLSRQPRQWSLRSLCVYYLGRNYVNYPHPQDALAAGERFVICSASNLPALQATGYRPYLALGDHFWLMGLPPPGVRKP